MDSNQGLFGTFRTRKTLSVLSWTVLPWKERRGENIRENETHVWIRFLSFRPERASVRING